MYVTSHAIIGACVGGAIAQAHLPLSVVVTSGLVSHALLDMIPHHDYDTVSYAVVDVVITAVLLYLLHPMLTPLWGYHWLWGALAATIPDLEVAYVHLVKHTRYRVRFPSHNGWLPHPQLPFVPGFLSQIVVVGLAICLLACFLPR